MTKPVKVVIHNTISLDGAVTGFEVDTALHYEVASRIGADAMLIGSRTAKAGADAYDLPVELPSDMTPRPPGKDCVLWAFVDSTGLLEGLLHVFRRFERCGQVVVIGTERTPPGYLQYLEARGYPFHAIGTEHVDLTATLEMLADTYHRKVVQTDSGGVLTNLLLEEELVDELSVVVAPLLVGGEPRQLFETLEETVQLQLEGVHPLESGAVHLHYRVCRDTV